MSGETRLQQRNNKSHEDGRHPLPPRERMETRLHHRMSNDALTPTPSLHQHNNKRRPPSHDDDRHRRPPRHCTVTKRGTPCPSTAASIAKRAASPCATIPHPPCASPLARPIRIPAVHLLPPRGAPAVAEWVGGHLAEEVLLDGAAFQEGLRAARAARARAAHGRSAPALAPEARPRRLKYLPSNIINRV